VAPDTGTTTSTEMPGPPGGGQHSEARRWPANSETKQLPGAFLVVRQIYVSRLCFLRANLLLAWLLGDSRTAACAAKIHSFPLK
jgi:hypothetical protein